MLRKIPVLIILFIFPLTLRAQGTIPVYSAAAYLFQQLNTSGGKPSLTVDNDVVAELAGVFGGSHEAIAAALRGNPFLKDKIDFISAPEDERVIAQRNLIENFDMVNTGPSDLNLTNVADAVATLMIDRAKEELTLAFFNHLQAYSAQHPEFQTLFPKTFGALGKLATYSYLQILPALRTAFLADLGQVPYNLEAVLELPRYKTLVDNLPEINMAIQVLKIYHQLENGTTPDKIIAAIDQAASSLKDKTTISGGALFQNLLTTVHFAQLFSGSLRDGNGEGTWISGDEAKALLSNDLETDLYLAVLWQQAGNLKLSYSLMVNKKATDIPLQTLMGAQADNVLLFQNKISQFLTLAAKVTAAYTLLNNKAPGEKVTPAEYSAYISSSLDAIDCTFSTVKLFDQRLQSDNYLDIVEKSGDLYKDIYAKQYTQAVSDGLDVIGSVQALSTGDGGAGIGTSAGAFSFQQSADTLTVFVKKIKPYAMFMANVAEAQSENDVESALDNAILPVGSSSIKKNTGNNLCLQTYLGGYYSFQNFSPDAIRAWSDKVGVYGPVGLAYTPGIFSWGSGGSLSVFASAFDLGAIIDYKLKTDPSVTTSTTTTDASTKTKSYSVNLNQLFSPGAHLVYGFFSNLPLSLGVGAEYGPGLSKITAAGTSNVINPCWRFNVFLAVDLPFFNLINIPRTK